MSEPVRFQQFVFHNTLGIDVAVSTNDGGGGGFVDRGKVAAQSKRDIHIGLENCKMIEIRAGDYSSTHSAESITLRASPDGKDSISNAEVAYNIGSFAYRLTLTSERFPN